MRIIFFSIFASFNALLLALPYAIADQSPENNGFETDLPVWANSVNRKMYNIASALPWNHRGGDWVDRQGKEQGTVPFSTFRAMTPGVVNIDATDLIKMYHHGSLPNNGIFIKGGKGSSIVNIHSLESGDVSKHPTLNITTENGKKYNIHAAADTYIDPTTLKSLHKKKYLKLTSDRRSLLIYFPLHVIPKKSNIIKAEIHLEISKRYGNKPVIGELYALQPGGIRQAQKVQTGIAYDYPQDIGLDEHPDVFLSENFDSFLWRSQWSETGGNLTVVSGSPLATPDDGKALQLLFKKGTRTAANITYKFSEKAGTEPESIYFRYYILLSKNWNPIVGGKFPGIAGTYGKAGWGGRKSDGFNGWSTRGAFRVPLDNNGPLGGLTPIGTYAYTADMSSKYGNYWSWNIGEKGLLQREQWYSIEQFVQLNTPGKKDGVLKAWLDGKLVFDKRDIMYRRTDTLKIDRIWINFYHGGLTVIPNDQDLYIDNVVIAGKYIGPMRRK